ncbi:MAG: sigma-70 family RNA polymerase sigma factor [Polyangiaceae bacterium]
MHPETAAELERALGELSRVHPAIHVTPSFVAFAERIMASSAPAKVPPYLSDVLVAHAAVHGNARALSLVEAALKELPPMLARFHLSESDERELLQELRLRVLVGSDAETMASPNGAAPSPRLLDYHGSGPLGAWLRASAVRLVLTKFRKQARLRESEASEDAGDPAAAGDVELAHAKRLYQEPFQKAFRAAMEELTPRDRAVLRMHLLDGRSIDEIGAVFRVHRATIARWISDARATVGKRTQALLTANLHTDSAEFRSITRLCYSQLDVSLHSLFEAQTGSA